MTEKQLEFNRDCAFFLQWKNKGMVNLEMWVSDRTPIGANTNELLFHKDWNWLMDVVKKALDICFEEDQVNDYYYILDAVPDIDTVVERTHSFIKKLNLNKT